MPTQTNSNRNGSVAPTATLSEATRTAHALLAAAFYDGAEGLDAALSVPPDAMPDTLTRKVAEALHGLHDRDETIDPVAVARLLVQDNLIVAFNKQILERRFTSFDPARDAALLRADFDRHEWAERRRELQHAVGLAASPAEVAGLLAGLDSDAAPDGFVDDNTGWRALAAMDPPFLFPGVPMAATTLLAGPGGVGKSTLARGLVLSCLTGRRVFTSFPCSEPGRVVTLSGEDSPIVFFRSVLSIAIQHGIPAGEVDAGMANLTTVKMARPFPFVRSGQTTPEYAELRALCRRLKPKLLLVDTARRYGGIQNENDAAEVGMFMQAVSDIAVEVGCAALVLHHAAKHAEGRGQTVVRGSSVFADECRSCFTLYRDGDVVTLHHAKSNFGHVAGVAFSLDGGGIAEVTPPERDTGGLLVTVCDWLAGNPNAVLTVHGARTRQGGDAKALLAAVARVHAWADAPAVADVIQHGLDDGTLGLESRRGSNGRMRQCISVNTHPARTPHTPTPPVNRGVCGGALVCPATPDYDPEDDGLPF